MSKVSMCLWFDGQAEEAARFYTSLLPDSGVGRVLRTPGANRDANDAAPVLSVEFTLAGVNYIGLNGGPEYQFTPATSIFVHCDDQAEIDRLWTALSADGGAPSQCGWLTDRFGMRWQIVPRELGAMLADADQARTGRVMQALFGMSKIDIGALQAAADG